MAAGYNTIDLARFALSPGEGRRIDLDVPSDELELAGQRYEVGAGTIATRLDLSRTAGGHAMRLRFATRLTGPCMRCLEEADVEVRVDAREVDQPSSGDEELRSPYVSEEELDIGSWARDSLVLALPVKVLCRPDCLGLCPVCGISLNDADADAHTHDPPPDPRWEKLRELRAD